MELPAHHVVRVISERHGGDSLKRKVHVRNLFKNLCLLQSQNTSRADQPHWSDAARLPQSTCSAPNSLVEPDQLAWDNSTASTRFNYRSSHLLLRWYKLPCIAVPRPFPERDTSIGRVTCVRLVIPHSHCPLFGSGNTSLPNA